MSFNELAKMLRDNTLIKAENSSLSIFAEEPVSLDIFMRDKKYLGNPPLSLIQYNAVRAIERIYFPDMYPLLAAEFGPKKNQTVVGPAGAFSQDVENNYWAAKIPMINKATLQWGKGAGKDHTCRIISMRIAYLLLCLHSPQAYYGVPEQDSIHLLNVATSSKQAQSAFFEPLSKAVRLGWFKDRADPHVSTVTYDKNIECISGHSDAETQEGLNLLLGIADEIDGFKSKQELEKTQRTKSNRDPSRSAESILELLESSAITRFPEVYKNVRISYPRYLGSMIQLLTEEAKQDIRENGKKSKHYVSGPLATWDVNPLRKKENFDEMYKKDAASARGKYECKPARSTNPYFRNHPAVDACLVKSEVPEITIDYVRSGEAWEAEYLFHPSLVPIQGARYAMHADLAVRGDRAGISMAHVVKNVEFENIVIGEDGEELPFLESRPYVKVDFVICFESNITCEPPREIQIRWARQLCFELIKRGFNIRQFTFDAFQCLSGDTEIPLLDGTTKTMKELEGQEPFWVYSINDEGHIVPGLCTKAWKTNYREDMVEVELDNGEVIKCTSDHLFMMRDGSYKPAQELKLDDSLMPLYRKYSKLSYSSEPYEYIRHPSPLGNGQHWRPTHSMVSHYCYGDMPKGWVTHHINVNSQDNRPENLVQLTNEEHSRLHREMDGGGLFGDLWKDPEWSAKQKKIIAATQREKLTGKFGKDAKHYNPEITFELIVEKYEECVFDGVTPTRAEVQARVGCSQSPLYDRIRGAGFKSWKDFRNSREVPTYSTLAARKSRAKKIENVGVEEYRRLHNHKVVAVRASHPEDVYDLQVEDYHNFATKAGVFVHNSTDSQQSLNAKGIPSKRVSTDVDSVIWRTLQDMMYESRCIIPFSELLREELLSLTRLPNGKIDHLLGGSKDLADSLACAVTGALELGGSEGEEPERAYYEPARFVVGPMLRAPFSGPRDLGLPIGMEQYLPTPGF